MPGWNPQANELFLQAVQKTSADERAAWLDGQCAGNAELRAEVESLLAARAAAGSFLDSPAVAEHDPRRNLMPAAFASTGNLAPLREQPGAVIGRYKLRELIGEGGMGTVWIAEQSEPVRRKVALKLVKPGMDSREVLSRFEVERQALALMDHPNIAKVHDGGVTEIGRPYFVMEYVKGISITQYCDQAKLTVKERLKLFVQVCQAIQHAHQKGIIHRDLKPSNILVCLYDGQPIPKIIDFGLAKAMNQPLTENTLYTAHGLMVGTPLYMSPEQAEFNNLDVDTRTDIYSLGVVLYELLTGTTPLERQQFKEAALEEILRLIKEEDPQKPSTKISGSIALPTIAAQRGLDPGQLSRVVKGDLDWIAMKALEKDRSRRYETASGLARDVQRYLDDEPVEACPPSVRYRLRKFARRNRAFLGTAVLVGLALVAGTAVALWQAAEATRSANAARKNESDAVAATAKFERANQELKKKNDEVETALVRSLLRPLAQQPGTLTEAEVGALWELAVSPGDRTRKRFLDEALRESETTRQLKNRAEPGLHAAVGLDSEKRLQVEQLLIAQMQKLIKDDRQQAEVALLAVALGDLTPTAEAEVARTLTETLSKGTDALELRELAEGLASLAADMEPEEAGRVCSHAADILCETLPKSPSTAFEPIAHGLAALAARLESSEADRVCSRAADYLTAAMNANATASWVAHAYLGGLIVLAPHIKPDHAARAGAAIVLKMDSGYDYRIPDALAAIAPRMDPVDAARICSQVVARRPAISLSQERYVQLIKAVVPYLTSSEAGKLASVLTGELSQMKDAPADFAELASAFATLAPKLDAEESAKLAGVLANELSNAKSSDELVLLFQWLHTVAPHLEAKEAARLYSPSAYRRFMSGNSYLIAEFSAVATRMEPHDGATALLQGMKQSGHPTETLGFAVALSKVAARLDSDEAGRVCSRAATILDAEMKNTDESRIGIYSRALTVQSIFAIAPYLESKARDQAYSQAIAVVLGDLARVSERDRSLFEALAVVAVHMEPKDAVNAATIVNRVLNNQWDTHVREVGQLHGEPHSLIFQISVIDVMATALTALADRLDSKDAARVCRPATEIVIDALAKVDDTRLAKVLAKLAGHLEPDEAAIVCSRAAAILANSPLPVLSTFPDAIPALAVRMESTQAARVCSKAAADYIDAMAMTRPSEPLSYANGLSTIITGFDPRLQTPKTQQRLTNRLSPQELVELLKHPTCVDHARRIILDHLGGHYERTFSDQWAFVRFAKEKKLDIDFITPPALRIPHRLQGLTGHRAG